MISQNIRTAQSCATDARQAVRELHAGIAQPDTELVLFFCSSEYDKSALADEMNQLFAGMQVVGCTTAGEIGPAGYLSHSLCGVSFRRSEISAVSGLLDELRDFNNLKAHEFSQTMLQKLERKAPHADAGNSFAILLIDGMSIREEPVTHALQASLGAIPMLGGSAGDDGRFEKTWVFHEGRFHADSAVSILISTALPFTLFMNQHFAFTEERLVVTEADTATRTVRELNGMPAAQEYARLLGVPVEGLDAAGFASSPLLVVIDGVGYVRSIQKIDPDGSMKFFCAIEEGVVLRLGHGQALLEKLEEALDRNIREIGQPQVVIGFDCILRKQEITQRDLKERVSDLLRGSNTVGFNSYGEQFHGIHVNQTFTGIAIGKKTGRQ
jgi:hypothetical protein